MEKMIKDDVTKPWHSDRWKGYNDQQENTEKEMRPEMKEILVATDMWGDKKGKQSMTFSLSPIKKRGRDIEVTKSCPS